MVDVIRECKTCTRSLAIEQFRQLADGARLRQCKQCENADRSFRRMPKAEPQANPLDALLKDWFQADPDQLRQTP